MTLVGMVLDGVSIFLVFLPLLYPLMIAFAWDPVWFGVLLTMKIAIGQFTPPMAVNLMVACRLAQVRMEQTLALGRVADRLVRRRHPVRAVRSRSGAVAAAAPGLLIPSSQPKETSP